ncbi:MAG: hypothetical protein UU47_C0017G0007 [candidate division TM6 bacterium GW2011_GWE2_41_16]|nr:MAG: hypothetical protein UU47_C0017G0007 [candidate division TM6 bacterium GW2011_GWE2_41_16]
MKRIDLSMTIKQLFVPEVFDTYFTWRQRIVAIEFGEKMVRAAVVVAKGNKRTIELTLQEPIPDVSTIIEMDREEQGQTPPDTRFIALLEAIKKVKKIVGRVDKVFCTLPTTQILFKDVTMPFGDDDKIRKIIPFEIESLLPFPLADAAISFIKTQQNSVMVAITKQTVVDYYEQLFKDADWQLDKLSTESVDLYAFLHKIGALLPTNKEEPAAQMVIHVGDVSSFFMLVQNGVPVSIKALPLPFDKNADKTDLFMQALGVSYASALKKADIDSVQTCFLTGIGSDNPAIVSKVEQIVGRTVTQLHPALIFKSSDIVAKDHNIVDSGSLICVALALVLPLTESFDLFDKKVLMRTDDIIGKQVIAGACLAIIILGTIFGYSVWRQHQMSVAITKAENDAIKKLKDEFGLSGVRGANTLTSVQKKAQEKLQQEQTIWYALTWTNKNLFLSYLQELTTHINRKNLGLDLKKIELKTTDNPNQDILVFDGSVRGFSELKDLENTFKRMPLIMNPPSIQDTKFALTLMLNKKYRELS